MDEDTRVQVKRNSKKKSGIEVELRDDGYYYVKSVPSKRMSIKPGDRVLEINGVNYTEFKTPKKANDLLDTLVLNVQEGTEASFSEDASFSEAFSDPEVFPEEEEIVSDSEIQNEIDSEHGEYQ